MGAVWDCDNSDYTIRMIEQGNPHTDTNSEPTAGRYEDDLFCPDCRYSLRGLTARNCPECGLDLGFVESAESVIPWQRRGELGAFKAYWLTVWDMMFRWKTVRKALYQPIDERSATLFRGITLAIATATIWAMLCMVGTGDIRIREDETFGSFALEGLRWPTVISFFIAIPIGLFISTGFVCYTHDLKEYSEVRRCRVVGLSQYSCAPLAGFPLMVIPNLIGVFTYNQSPLIGTILMSAAFWAIYLLWLFMIATNRIRKWLMPKWRKRWWYEIIWTLPMLFVVLGPVVGIPLAALLIHVILDTLC